jgi:hypothetical protein
MAKHLELASGATEVYKISKNQFLKNREKKKLHTGYKWHYTKRIFSGLRKKGKMLSSWNAPKKPVQGRVQPMARSRREPDATGIGGR